MLIFINGSINSGKTTTSKVLAEKLGAEFLDFDKLADDIPNFSLKKDIPKVIQKGIEEINRLNAEGKDVVANYVVRAKDYEKLMNELRTKDMYFFTLAPRLEVAQSDRGRDLNDWQIERIKYHYDTGVARPTFGEIIDNSDLSVDETVAEILNHIKK